MSAARAMILVDYHISTQQRARRVQARSHLARVTIAQSRVTELLAVQITELDKLRAKKAAWAPWCRPGDVDLS